LVNVERTEESIPNAIAVGIDVGLNHFYTDSCGETVPNHRYLGKSEKALKRTIAETSFKGRIKVLVIVKKQLTS
jgi:putative transposase